MVQIHREPLWKQLMHPDEIIYVMIFLVTKAWNGRFNHTKRLSPGLAYLQQHHPDDGDSSGTTSSNNNNTNTNTNTTLQDDLVWCQDMLGRVSRSFSTVIRQLPEPLMVDVLVFYLVLRALDTIEDDPRAFEKQLDKSGQPIHNWNPKRIKTNLLKSFSKMALSTGTTGKSNNSRQASSISPSWSLDGVGEGDERRLLQEFPRVQNLYRALSRESQTIITDITQRMGAGMAETIGKDLSQGTKDIAQYNTYCHYVAGLVGEGLSRLFAQSELEESYLADELYLSDQMGLFLQKTNIIRDYLEDFVEGRAFWPQSIWKQHVNEKDDLSYFIKQNGIVDSAAKQASMVACLNDMVTDALELVPACLAYLSELQCLEIFRFCAIPQVMAMATLEKLYANLDVFSGVVKIRKGLSCKLMLRTNNLDVVHEVFYDMAKSIEAKARQLQRSNILEESSTESLLDACDLICAITEPAHRRQRRARLMPMIFVTAVVACQNVPFLVLGLVAAGIVNYYFGPFQIHTNPNRNPAFLVIPSLWKEMMGKNR